MNRCELRAYLRRSSCSIRLQRLYARRPHKLVSEQGQRYPKHGSSSVCKRSKRTQGVASFEANEREEKNEPKGGWKFCGICGGELQDLIR